MSSQNGLADRPEPGLLTLLQEKFLKLGFEGLQEGEGIQLVLGLCRYRPDCDKRIRGCIKHFKSLRILLAASNEELRQTGVCWRGIFYIRLLRGLPEEILKEKIINKPLHKSSKEIFDYLYYSMRDLKKEVFKVIYLNNQNQIIDAVTLFEGTVEGIPIYPREIVENAIKNNATRLIFAHNHTSGNPTPSKSDKQLTRDLVFIGSVTEIKVLDHIIIGENTYFSFADVGLIKKYEDDFLNMRIKALFGAGHYHYVS